MKNPHQPFATTIALLPLACYLVLVAAACHTWFAVGNWPSYGNPDPKNLPVREVYVVAIYATLIGLVSVLLCPIVELAFLGLQRALKKDWKPHGSLVVRTYAIGSILWVIAFLRWLMDAGGLVNWIFD
ncbi:MAG: hypothetical protein ACREIA_22240 [Opitutaceae bacterium]